MAMGYIEAMQLYEETLQLKHPALKPEKLQAFVLWCLQEAETLEMSSESLQRLWEQTLPADIQACYEMLNQLDVQDLIGYTLLNEFGLQSQQYSAFCQFIYEVVGKRLSNSFNKPPTNKSISLG